jgi:diguanylate cyclase (GGDEF)-like protein
VTRAGPHPTAPLWVIGLYPVALQVRPSATVVKVRAQSPILQDGTEPPPPSARSTDVVLWNKNKPNDGSRVAATPANQSGYRVAEPDRALTAVGTLLKVYGRFAFDAAESAGALRERCEEWAQRLMLGEPRRDDGATGVTRDFRGAERFFEETRKLEGSYVTQQLSGLRRALLSLARALGASVGEDREGDAQVEQRLTALSRALDQGDITVIARTATAVIEASRGFMAQRREREARHTQKLDKELRELREQMSEGNARASSDELTGLFGRAQLEQQLEQLSALGALLAEPPWLLLIDVAAGKHGARNLAKPVPDATLREVSHCISRTFLRRQDFAARAGANELAVLVVDMTESEVLAATERLLGFVHDAGRSLAKHELPNIAIGLARSRPNEDAERWRARANVALERAIQDDATGYALAPG